MRAGNLILSMEQVASDGEGVHLFQWYTSELGESVQDIAIESDASWGESFGSADIGIEIDSGLERVGVQRSLQCVFVTLASLTLLFQVAHRLNQFLTTTYCGIGGAGAVYLVFLAKM
jgi:hypothetical protein